MIERPLNDKSGSEKLVCFVKSSELTELSLTKEEVAKALKTIIELPAVAIGKMLADKFIPKQADEETKTESKSSSDDNLPNGLTELLRRGVLIEVRLVTASGEKVSFRDLIKSQ